MQSSANAQPSQQNQLPPFGRDNSIAPSFGAGSSPNQAAVNQRNGYESSPYAQGFRVPPLTGAGYYPNFYVPTYSAPAPIAPMYQPSLFNAPAYNGFGYGQSPYFSPTGQAAYDARSAAGAYNMQPYQAQQPQLQQQPQPQQQPPHFTARHFPYFRNDQPLKIGEKKSQ